MSTDDVLEFLAQHHAVSEPAVLVREARLFLDVGHSRFRPRIGVKIYKVVLGGGAVVYQFDVSHHVHTPSQMDAYYPSRTTADSEREAFEHAISTTAVFLKTAIAEGHEPTDRWLVENKEF
jgi:hypothetical protein